MIRTMRSTQSSVHSYQSNVRPANALTGAFIKDTTMDWSRLLNFRKTVGDDVALQTLQGVDGLDAAAVMAAIESKEGEIQEQNTALDSLNAQYSELASQVDALKASFEGLQGSSATAQSEQAEIASKEATPHYRT